MLLLLLAETQLSDALHFFEAFTYIHWNLHADK
jgi:hypothetical protein